MQIFDKNIDLLQKVLELRSRKNEVLAANIANRETPNFKAQDLLFENQLQQAYYKSNQSEQLKVTHSRHIAADSVMEINEVQGQHINSFSFEAGYDGNTVDLDQQMAKLSENQLLFESASNIISRKLRILKETIVEGGK